MTALPFLIFFASLLGTFVYGYMLHKYVPKRLIVKKYQFHHSLVGVILIIAGVFLTLPSIFLAVGLGIYFSHVIEEVCFNDVSPRKALFMFITKPMHID